MTKSIFYFLLIINLSAQSDKIVPSIIEIDGVVIKSNEETPYTGKVSIYWENDQLKEEGLYREGIKSGLWKYWYKSGVLYSKGIFRTNSRTGVWIEWYENTNKKIQTIYILPDIGEKNLVDYVYPKCFSRKVLESQIIKYEINNKCGDLF